MSVRRISSGSEFEARIGYSRAVVSDGFVFVSGTTGYDYRTMVMPESVTEQCENILQHFANVLSDAGSSLDHVVQVRYILPDRNDFEPCWPLLAAAFKIAQPAVTMFVADLMHPEMKIEIELVARMPHSAGEKP